MKKASSYDLCCAFVWMMFSKKKNYVYVFLYIGYFLYAGIIFQSYVLVTCKYIYVSLYPFFFTNWMYSILLNIVCESFWYNIQYERKQKICKHIQYDIYVLLNDKIYIVEFQLYILFFASFRFIKWNFGFFFRFVNLKLCEIILIYYTLHSVT